VGKVVTGFIAKKGLTLPAQFQSLMRKSNSDAISAKRPFMGTPLRDLSAEELQTLISNTDSRVLLPAYEIKHQTLNMAKD